MNIFVLDLNPMLAAEYHCDKHVVKMILETAQLLCGVHHFYNITNLPYKATHLNHPCAIWARASRANYKWLGQLGYALCEEYTYRYQKIHKSTVVIHDLMFSDIIIPEENLNPTPFALAMPDEYKSADAVESYRQYYLQDKIKNIQCKWTKRNEPWWVNVVHGEQINGR